MKKIKRFAITAAAAVTALSMCACGRTKELVKQAKTLAEEARTSIRNIRRDGNDDLKKKQKASEITEDELKTEEDKLQKLTDKYVAEINKIYEAKEKDIMEG